MDSRVVIVTGASSGIGEATAKAFGARGDRVVLVARREDRLRQLAAALPQSLPLPGDLANTDEAFRTVEGTEFRQDRRANTGYLMPRWLRLSTAQVAEAIVTLADRPRPFVVLPRIFQVAILLNTLAPGLIDRLAARMVHSKRIQI